VKLVVTPEGSICHIYSEKSLQLSRELGLFQIQRASYVEPLPSGEWLADLSIVGGPVLGPFPPESRDKALEAELEWLERNLSQVALATVHGVQQCPIRSSNDSSST